MAVLSDVHANPWALAAVLDDVARVGVDLVVNCGDLTAGPWPQRVVDQLAGFGLPVVHVRGNGDRMVADAHDGRPGWEADVPAPARTMVEWAAEHLREGDRRLVGAMPLSVVLDVAGLGPVTFFHATATSDEEVVLPTTPDADVVTTLEPVRTAVAVCGHTHLVDDRTVGPHRLVNAGSVGKPFDANEPAWLLLGPGVTHRRVPYDTARAAATARRELGADARASAVAEEFAESLTAPGREATLAVFTPLAGLRRGDRLVVRSRLMTLDG